MSHAFEQRPVHEAPERSAAGPPPPTDIDGLRTAEPDPLRALAERIVTAEGAWRGGLPDRALAASFCDNVVRLLFPGGHRPPRSAAHVQEGIDDLCRELAVLLRPLEAGLREPASYLCAGFLDGLPEIYDRLRLDAAAIEAGDPAARSVAEVVVAYPGFAALAFHRIAHAFHALGVPLLPRMLAEVAHSRTGIDIHPGATIGRSCCIDHGTGLVIGETAVIGDDVKLYQGVTLGALSVVKSAAGAKRHPTIEDRVVIYANATVLGGDTVVGHDSVVGGNVWLMHSVPPFSLVYHTSQVRVRSAADGALEPSDFVI